MGAKLSKKKKGYCLGAGKDGESTETTEVEQKETETQEGHKVAAEPLGEKTPIDQTKNNGASEEPKAHAEKRSSAEVTSGDTTKENSNKDQKPDKKQEETVQHVESSNTTQEQACEVSKDGKSPSGDKLKTDCDLKKEESAVKETQESLPVVVEKGSDIIQPNQTVTQEASSALDEKEVVAKCVTEPVTKVEVEKEKSPIVVPKIEQLSEQATKEATQVVDSLTKLEQSEKVSEVVEMLGPEEILVEPVSVADVELKMQEPVSDVESKLQEPVLEHKLQEEPVLVPDVESKLQESVLVPDIEPVVPEPLSKSVDPEPVEPPLPVTELVKSDLDLVPEPAESAVSKSVPVVESINEQPTEPVPVAEAVRPVSNPESCHESEQVCEMKEAKQCPSEQLLSNEVPDQIEDHTENKETLDFADQRTNAAEIKSAISESAPAEQTSDVTSAEQNTDQEAFVMQNGTSENSEQDVHVNTSAVQEVEDKQKEVKEEEQVLDKQSTEQTGQVGEDDCYDSAVVILESKNETDQTFKATTGNHDPSEDCKAEDKTKNEETPVEEHKDEKESSAPQIINKHGVGNGLPLKEEIKVHIENGSDKDLHELNGQGEGHEIQVCNE